MFLTMLIAVVPIIVLVVGLLAYAVPGSGERREMGRISFFVGLFFTVAAFARVTWHLW